MSYHRGKRIQRSRSRLGSSTRTSFPNRTSGYRAIVEKCQPRLRSAHSALIVRLYSSMSRDMYRKILWTVSESQLTRPKYSSGRFQQPCSFVALAHSKKQKAAISLIVKLHAAANDSSIVSRWRVEWRSVGISTHRRRKWLARESIRSLELKFELAAISRPISITDGDSPSPGIPESMLSAKISSSAGNGTAALSSSATLSGLKRRISFAKTINNCGACRTDPSASAAATRSRTGLLKNCSESRSNFRADSPLSSRRIVAMQSATTLRASRIGTRRSRWIKYAPDISCPSATSLKAR